MTKEELIQTLQRIVTRPRRDPESDHWDADEALLKYINDPDVDAAWGAVEKWYA